MKIGFILLGVALLAFLGAAQDPKCETFCGAFLRDHTFRVPLGELYAAIRALLCVLRPETCPSAIAELVTALTIPDLEITLSSDVVIKWVEVGRCSPCCPPGVKLYAFPNVSLMGSTKPIGLPPTVLAVTTSLTLPSPVEDEGALDRNAGIPCDISAGPFTIPSGQVRASLVLPVRLTIPLWERKGELLGKVWPVGCQVSYGCTPFLNRPPRLSVPNVVKAVAGQVTPIPFDVEDPDGDFVHVYIEPVSLPGLELYYDRELGAYVIHVSKTYEGREEYSIRVWAYDLKPAMRGRLEPWEAPEEGQYHHKVLQVFILRITRNRPPIAISGSLTVSHGEIGCFGPVHYKGYDPDLPENFGFGLYFVALGFPANWDCSRMVDIYFSPLTHSLVPQQCIANICELLTTCTYWPCDWPRHPVPEGKYVFPFAVVEYKRWAIKPEEPENYGFSDAGHWTLIVNNKRPRVVVEPAEIKVAPGQIVAAMVKAEDDDNDWLELRQTGGPGSFPPKVEGLGKVQGTWSWTVPGRLLSYSGYASFVARDFASAGYGFLYVRTVNPPQASSAHALVPRGGTSTAYAYVHDPDSPWISVQPGPAPPGLSVSAQVEDDPFAPGLGGFLVVFEVSAERTLCDGVYTVPFTVTDPDGLSASALLTVRVVGNRPPEVRGAQGKEAVVQLTPAGVSAPPVVFVLELRDPDGDRPG